MLRLRRWSVIALSLCVLLWLLPATGALAHARLLESSPPDGATLSSSPGEIQLRFSEPIAVDFSVVKVLDRSRRDQAIGPATKGSDGETSLQASLLSTLQPGTYAVVWRVVSAVDGHITSGSIAFRVAGNNAQSTPEPPEAFAGLGGEAGDRSAGQNPDPLRWLLHATILACAMFALGGALFTLLVLEPTFAEKEPTTLQRLLDRRFAGMGGAASALLLVTLALDLFQQVALIAQTDLLGAFQRDGLARSLLSTTRYGLAWSIKALSALALFAVFLFAQRRTRRFAARSNAGFWELCIGAGSFFFLAEALSSHAAASQGEETVVFAWPVVSDWLHLVAAAVWAGGLLYMAALLFPALARQGGTQHGEAAGSFLARSVPRFSRLALAGVLTLGVTGTYNLAVHSTDLGAIAASLYGQVVFLKVALFGALVALGAVNLVVISPALRGRVAARKQPPQAENAAPAAQPSDLASLGARLKKNVRTEAAIMGVVLICAGGLTLLPPPAGEYTGANLAGAGTSSTPTTAPVSPARQPATAATAVAGYNLVFATRPSEADNELELSVSRSNKELPPLDDITKVFFVVTSLDLEGGGTIAQAIRQGEASPDGQTWSARGALLQLEGKYLVNAVVQRNTPPDLKAAYLITVSDVEGVAAAPVEYLDLRFTTEPEPSVVGQTTRAVVMLRTASGAPMEQAHIEATVTQAVNPQTAIRREAVPVVGEPGSYEFTIDFPAPGGWTLLFVVERQGQPTIRSIAGIDVVSKP